MPNYVKPFVSLIDGTLLNLPAADGATGQVMQTDGAGALSFVSVLKDVVDDTAPQLGGNLDAQSNDITSVGNLGIGTATPATLLTMEETVSVSTPMLTIHANTSTTEAGGTIDFANSSQVSAIGARIASHRLGAGAYSDLRFSVLPSGGSLTEAMRIDSTGYVGIGTTSSASNLHVEGTTASGNVGILRVVNNTTTAGQDAMRIMMPSAASGALNFSNNSGNFWRWFLGTAGEMRFDSADGVSKMYLTETGNLGLGAAPGAKLHTSGGDMLLDNTYSIQWKDSSGTARDIVTVDSGDNTTLRHPAGSSGDVYLGSAGLFTLKSSTGRLGIGESSPGAKLHAVGPDGAGSTPAIDAFGTVGIFENNSDFASNSYISLIAGTEGFAGINFGDDDDENTGSINYNHLDDELDFWTSALQRMVITSSGNVGIGTSSPGELLDVAGDARITNLGLNTLASSSYNLYSSNNTAGLGGALFEGSVNAIIIDDVNNYTGLGTADFTAYNGANFVQFGTAAGHTAVFAGGNVGIGDTAPGHLLEIADGFRTAPVSSPSGTAEDGRIYMDSDDSRLKVYANGADRPLNTMTPISIRPQQLIADSTSGFGITTRNQHVLAAFDDTTDEIGYYTGVLPDDYQGDGLTVEINWVAATATTNATTWTAAFERIAQNGQDIDSDGFNTAQTQNSNCQSTNGRVTRSEIEFTNSQIDGLLAGEVFRLKVTRDTTDTMTGDAQIVGIQIRGTNDA